jgi:hypothetical protein
LSSLVVVVIILAEAIEPKEIRSIRSWWSTGLLVHAQELRAHERQQVLS